MAYKDSLIVTAAQTGGWMARCIAANQTKPGPLFYNDEMGPLDAPEWIATGGVSVTACGHVVVHMAQRGAEQAPA